MPVLRLGAAHIGSHPSLAVREPEPFVALVPSDATGQLGFPEARLLLRGPCLLGIRSSHGAPLAVDAEISPPAPSRGHGCGLRNPLPAVQDRGLGNVLLAAISPSLAIGISAPSQLQFRWGKHHDV